MASKKKKTTSKRKKADQRMQKNLDAKFVEELNEVNTPTFGNETITRMNVADANLDFVRLFGANKNLYRTTPNLISGLKPGATRLYYNWWEISGRPQNTKPETLKKVQFNKVNFLASGSVKYHPHGTVSQEELIGTAGQYWSNNVMMLVPQGSYGNLRGETPAAGRYLEAQLSEYAIDCFFDSFDKYSVPMRMSYTGKDYEPEYLPAKYPHILFNPQFSGIGYGLSSNIPPFNVAEVLDATISLIKNPKAKVFLYPDSPTGADIVDEGQFKEINKTGSGKFVMKATSVIDYAANTISITSLPINSSSSSVIEKIIELRAKGNDEFQHIVKFDDNTQEGFVEIIIYLDNKDDTRPDKVLKELYKRNVGLKTTFPVGIAVVDDFKLYEYGVKDLLLAWIDYRLDAVRSMTLNGYQQAIAKQHMNDVLLMVFNKDNIEDTISIAKKSKNKQEIEEKLMKRFKITSAQAKTIAEMHVYQFNKEQYKKFVAEGERLANEIKELKDRLETPGAIEEFVINQLKEGKKKYGRPRLSNIITEETADELEVPNTDHIIGISESGYIKKVPESVGMIGMVGKKTSPVTALSINNRESILTIDSTGMITKILVSKVPDVEPEDIGVSLNQVFEITGTIKAVMELPTTAILEEDSDDLCIVLVTKKGQSKRVRLSAFKDLAKSKKGITLNSGDEVVTAFFSLDTSTKDIIIYTNTGRGIRLDINDIPMQGPSSKGMLMTPKLAKDEYIVGASKIRKGCKLFFFITTSGKGKVTESKYLPVMARTNDLINLINLDDGEDLIGVSAVDKSDIIAIYRKKTGAEEIKISDLKISMRNSSGDQIIKGVRSNPIMGFKTYKKN